MKYNTTYSPKMSLRKTLEVLALYKTKIFGHLTKTFNLISVDLPAFETENSYNLVDLDSITRNVTFDFGNEYKLGSLFLSHSNWMRSLIQRLQLEANQGVIGYSSYVWRDLEENPTKTIVKNEISLQFVLPKDLDYVQHTKNLTQDIYALFLQLSFEIQNEFQINNQYPETPSFISANFLETQMPNYTFKEREIKTILNHDAFFFEAPGAYTYSGKIHTFFPPFVYDLQNQYQIVLKDKINTEVLKVATISVLASGQQMKDQLKMYHQENYLEKPFYSSLTRKEQKIVEVKINFSRLMMAMLQKGHIGEVQSDVKSKEAQIIKSKYKVEII